MPPPGWTPLAEDVNTVFSPTTRELNPGALPGSWTASYSDPECVDLGAVHSIGAPIHVYPLYEHGFRAHRCQDVGENHVESAQLYAEFASVAATNEYAWSYGQEAQTESSISTLGKKNRMICTPYPLLMNAFNTVNLSAACIITSTEHARKLGVSEDRWIYPLGGAGTRDSDHCEDSESKGVCRFANMGTVWERPAYWWSPALSRSLDAGINVSALRKEDIDLFDFYSCVHLLAHHCRY